MQFCTSFKSPNDNEVSGTFMHATQLGIASLIFTDKENITIYDF